MGRLKPPAHWAAVLRQSTRDELAAMLQVLPRCRTWTEFFTRYRRAWELTSRRDTLDALKRSAVL